MPKFNLADHLAAVAPVSNSDTQPVIKMLPVRKIFPNENNFYDILEYGSPRIPATHWMERGYEESKDAFLAAEQEAWNKHLDDLNL